MRVPVGVAAVIAARACGSEAPPQEVPRVDPPPVEVPAAAPALAAAPAPAAPPVTSDLPDDGRAGLLGCWRVESEHWDETWTFVAHGPRGLDVVRELGDAAEAERARIPAEVLYDPVAGTYGFGAAGRIHPLLFVVRAERARLAANAFSRHDDQGWAWTGSNLALRRCGSRKPGATGS